MPELILYAGFGINNVVADVTKAIQTLYGEGDRTFKVERHVVNGKASLPDPAPDQVKSLYIVWGVPFVAPIESGAPPMDDASFKSGVTSEGDHKGITLE